MLLGLIALSIEESLPLAPLLDEWAKDERGVQRGRVRRLARLLHSGRPRADSLEEIPGILADEDLLAIRFDSQMGTRTAAIRRRLDESKPAGRQIHRARPSKTGTEEHGQQLPVGQRRSPARHQPLAWPFTQGQVFDSHPQPPERLYQRALTTLAWPGGIAWNVAGNVF